MCVLNFLCRCCMRNFLAHLTSCAWDMPWNAWISLCKGIKYHTYFVIILTAVRISFHAYKQVEGWVDWMDWQATNKVMKQSNMQYFRFSQWELWMCHLLGYSVMQPVCEPMFRRDVSPPASGLRPAWPLAALWFLVLLIFNSEDGSDTFLRYVVCIRTSQRSVAEDSKIQWSIKSLAISIVL
jgi:hypothetical protein